MVDLQILIHYLPRKNQKVPPDPRRWK
jgi:hypothetical protein